MARPKNKYPIPTLRIKNGIFRIRWRDNNKRYEFSTGLDEADASRADIFLMQVSLALRGAEEWPEWALGLPVVEKWIESQKPVAPEDDIDSIAALEEWGRHHRASASSDRQTIARMNQIRVLMYRYHLLDLTPGEASEFFDYLGSAVSPQHMAGKLAAMMKNKSLSKAEIFERVKKAGIDASIQQVETALRNREVFDRTPPPGRKQGGKYSVRKVKGETGLSPKTRNDYLIAFNMFYRWAVKQKFIKINPFDGIKPVRVEDHADIVWLNKSERDAITDASEGLPCEVPVWIALYAGLRLGEISRLLWCDVDLKGRWIHIRKSKTGKSRRTPISAALLKKLKSIADKTGLVAPHWQDARRYIDAADSDLIAVRKDLPELADKIKWNVFRHTFASLLAQTGKVTIDQVSALMGNTPEVCRRHYAHLIPDAVERTGIDLID